MVGTLPQIGHKVVGQEMEVEGGQEGDGEQGKTDRDEITVEGVIWSFILVTNPD